MEAWKIKELEKLKEEEERTRLYIEEELIENDPAPEVDTYSEDPTLVDFEVDFSI